MRTIIISAGNSAYWPYLSGLLRSIDAGRRSSNIDVGILDLGLATDQLRRLEIYGAKLVTPKWDYDLSSFAKSPPPVFRAMTARPHLPSYFPGYDIYLWIDADCWVQDWRAVEMLCLAAKDFGLCAVPEIDRSYMPDFAGGSFSEWYRDCLIRCFGEEVARKWQNFPILNCGVVAASRGSELWQHWDPYLSKAFGRLNEPFFFAEQTAFNVAVREEAFSVSFLPARCNWMCHRALPRLSFDARTFIDPQPPFEPLGILHLAANTKDALMNIPDMNGLVHSIRLAHPMLD